MTTYRESHALVLMSDWWLLVHYKHAWQVKLCCTQC